MSIAIAGKRQHRAAGAIRAHSSVEPDLARATLNLVGFAVRRLRYRRQLPPQFNEVAIAIVPVVQDRKIADDLVNVSHCVQARTLIIRAGFYIESNAAEVDISGGGGEGSDAIGGQPPEGHTAWRVSFRGAGARHGAARSAGVSVFCESLAANARSAGLPSWRALSPPVSFRFRVSVTNS